MGARDDARDGGRVSVLHVAAWAAVAAFAYILAQALIGIVSGVYVGVREALRYRRAVKRMSKMTLAELRAYAERNVDDPPSGG